MKRILIAGKIELPADKRSEALAGAKDLVMAARAEEGCIAYDWSADPYHDGRINVYEEWTGEAELAIHLAGEPYKGMLVHLQGFGILSAVTHKYRVDHFEPVYDPEGVPRADFFTA